MTEVVQPGTSSSPALARTACQARSRPPPLKRPSRSSPGNTHRQPSRRGSASRQAHRRRRQLDRARSGLGIGEVEFAGFKIDIRPAQSEYLRSCGSRSASAGGIAAMAMGEALALSTASCKTRPSRANSASVRKRSRRRSGYFSTDRQGIAAFRHHAPALAQAVHVRQDLDGPVRRERAVAQLLL